MSQKCTQRGNYGGGLSQAEKNALLNRHNQLRQWVAQGRETRGNPGPQPAAKNMQNMVLKFFKLKFLNLCDGILFDL